MVVFTLCADNLSVCLETFRRAQWPQIFRGIVCVPCLLYVTRPILPLFDVTVLNSLSFTQTTSVGAGASAAERARRSTFSVWYRIKLAFC